jgi:hypothetical protein
VVRECVGWSQYEPIFFGAALVLSGTPTEALRTRSRPELQQSFHNAIRKMLSPVRWWKAKGNRLRIVIVIGHFKQVTAEQDALLFASGDNEDDEEGEDL